MSGELRYAALISHSDADAQLAAWLKRGLEAYETPDAFLGRKGPAGPVSKRLGSFVSRRTEGKRELDAETRAALDQSEALIVLRPKRGAQHDHASEEIRYFKSLGRGERIIVAHTDGERRAGAHESFIWRKLVAEPGEQASADADPDTGDKRDADASTTADLRGGPHKRKGGKLRIISGLIGVGLHELVERERVAERARNARFAAAAAAAFVVCLSAGGVAWLTGAGPREPASGVVQVASTPAAPAPANEPAPAAAPPQAARKTVAAVAPARAKQPEPAPVQTAPAAAKASVRAGPVRVTQPTAVAAARPAAPARATQPSTVAARRPATPARERTTVVAVRPAAPARTNPPAAMVAAARPAAPTSPPAMVAAARPAAPTSPPATVTAARPAAPARTSPPATVAAARPAAPARTSPAATVAAARPSPPATIAAARPAAPARPSPPAAVAVSTQPAAPVRTSQPAPVAVASAQPAAPVSRPPSEPAPSRLAPATPIAQASAAADAGPQSTLLQQVRDLGAAQALAVRCEGRTSQASRNRAQTLIGSSPQPHQAALIGAFNDGYRSAEGRAEACAVPPTAG